MTTYIYLYCTYGLYMVLYIDHIGGSLSEDPKNVLMKDNAVSKFTPIALSLLNLFVS